MGFTRKLMFGISEVKIFIKSKIVCLVLVLLFYSCNKMFAQYNIDSIRGLSYEQFEDYFNKEDIDSVQDLIYANIYLEKAKKRVDTLKIVDAYYQLSFVHEYPLSLKYSDSIILITENMTENENLLVLAYMRKGGIYYDNGKLQKSVEEYLIAHKLAENSKDKVYAEDIKMSIGLIKNNLGENEEALKIFKDYISFVNKSKKEDKNWELVIGLLALADTYVSLNKYDSAGISIEKGLKISLKTNNLEMYAEFLNLCGINKFHTKNYQDAIDSISKAISITNIGNNISFAYLYLGKSKLALKDTIKALEYFLAVDSFLCKNEILTHELLEVYPPLIEHYNTKCDYAKQLFFTNQLIKFDDILDSTITTVSKNIIKNYDIPMLIASKEELIERLNKDKTLIAKSIYLLLFLSLFFIVLVFYFILRNIKYKKRFDKLLKQLQKKEESKKVQETKQDIIKEPGTESSKVNLNSGLVNEVLKRLEAFEKSKRYTNNNYTLDKLAKELKTNSTYLSKIINDQKGKNFSNYLKNLRIDFAISCLRNNPKFRTFTIQAIAEEVGFNKAQSFSVAFYKKTGLYPSYFIKQLEKQEQVINT